MTPDQILPVTPEEEAEDAADLAEMRQRHFDVLLDLVRSRGAEPVDPLLDRVERLIDAMAAQPATSGKCAEKARIIPDPIPETPRPAAPTDAERMQASRQRGAQVMAERSKKPMSAEHRAAISAGQQRARLAREAATS